MRGFPLWLLATLLAVGCSEPAEPNVPAATGSPALAQDPAERTIVEQFVDTVTFFDDCFGEEVLQVAHRQLVFYSRGEPTLNHFRLNIVEQGTTVTGLTSGTVWTVHGAVTQGGNGDITAAETPGEFNLEVIAILTSPGSTVNEQVRVRYHITINQDETVTVERFSLEVHCR
jgi:hypothetical protein